MLPIGTVILCHKCGAEIAEVVKVIHDGDIIKAEKLRGIDQEIKDGDLMTCKACGELWIGKEDGRTYTKDGWLS